MTAMLRDCRDRGEPLAGLGASEGTIYSRYGFSPATFQVRSELERSAARFLGAPPAVDGLELVSADTARAAWPGLHERAQSRPGRERRDAAREPGTVAPGG